MAVGHNFPTALSVLSAYINFVLQIAMLDWIIAVPANSLLSNKIHSNSIEYY